MSYTAASPDRIVRTHIPQPTPEEAALALIRRAAEPVVYVYDAQGGLSAIFSVAEGDQLHAHAVPQRARA